MAQEIIVDYKAEIDKITRDLEKYIDANEKLAKEQNKVQTELDQTTKAVDKLEKEFASAGKSSKAVNDNLKNFTKTAKTELSGVGNSVKSIGLGIAASIGAAFTVDAVIQFGKASINAFLEAQENAEKLRFTITQVGGESEAAFQRLIDQSAQLQDITIFSDDSIQQAQNALATFGLTADQIEELLPKLADFASATKVDIVQAAQQVGAGLQGAGREFKKFGIEVSATQTPMENLTEITEGFARFQGAAAKETETLTGQLKQQANAADDLQESIGEKLAPSYVKLKVAIFSAVEALLRYGKINAITQKDIVTQNKLAAQEVVDSVKQQTDSTNQQILVFRQLAQNAENEKRVLELTVSTKTRLGQLNRLEAEQLKDQIAGKQAVIDTFLSEIESIKSVVAEKAKELKADQLKLLSIEELNKLLKENQALNTITSQSNVDLINKELAARLKLEEQLKKEGDLRTKSNEEQIAQLETISDVDLTDLERIFIEATKGPQSFRDAVREAKEELDKLGESEFEVKLNIKNKERVESFKSANKEISDDTTSTYDQILSESFNLFADIVNLQNQFASQRIDKINDEKDAQLESLDTQTQALNENLSKRRISEKDAEAERKRLLDQRVAAEAEADKKIRAIKRRQAIINKIAAIAEIAISTAKNVAEFPALTAFYIAIGAAQAAIVAAQPIPYKKGTKSAKGGLSLVDEEGTEAIYRGRLTTLEKGDKVLTASKTKTYGEALDAMIDNRFDSWVMDKYLAPRLEAQNKSYKSGEQKSFARNLADANLINVTVPQGREMKSIRVNNLDELAELILNSRTSPYR